MVAVSTVFLILGVMAMRAPVNSGIQLRLISSSSSSGGRLEILYSSQWRPFCSTYFNSHEADLACKKLGYLRASNYGRVGQLGYSQYSGFYSSVKTTCYSYYTRFDSCSNSITSCSNYYDVAINCVNSGLTTYSPTSSPASVNSLRLVSSSYTFGSSGGRLEIYYYYSGRYAWRPFCSTYFNSHEANLACKKLGYSYASSYGRVGTLGYSQGTGLYSIQSNCYSSSTRFDSCSKSITSSCSRYYDVAIRCSDYSSTAGITTGLVTSFVLLFVCGGITVCATVVACIYHQHKKKSSGVRTINVVPTDPAPNIITATCTTTLTDQGNNTVADPAPPYTPTPYTSQPYTPNPYTPTPYTPTPYTSTMPQQEPYYPQKGGNYPNAYPAY